MDCVQNKIVVSIGNHDMLPLVSIVVPIFNSEKYIETTIDSIVSQTYKNIEIILVDDGSVDDSGNICTRRAKKDDRIKVIQIENNGPSHARNIGINYANGKYILPVDSDDLIHPTYVEKAVNIMENYSNMGIVFCKAKLFDAVDCEWDLQQYSLINMLFSNCIFATALFRKEDWVTVGGYSEDMKWGIEDYDFWLSIISIGREVFKIPEVLFFYRKHVGSRSDIFEKSDKKIAQMDRLIVEHHIGLYEKMFIDLKDKKIALYGAGRAGIVYNVYRSIKGHNDLVCWVDQKYEEMNIKGRRDICAPDKLANYSLDAIVVAINNDMIAKGVIKQLEDTYNIPVYWHIKKYCETI